MLFMWMIFTRLSHFKLQLKLLSVTRRFSCNVHTPHLAGLEIESWFCFFVVAVTRQQLDEVSHLMVLFFVYGSLSLSLLERLLNLFGYVTYL